MGVLGDVGGVQTILLVFGSLMTGMIAERLLYAKMMNQIYHAKVKDYNHKKKKNLFGSIKAQKLPAKSNLKCISNTPGNKSDLYSGDEEKGRNKIKGNTPGGNSLINRMSTYTS